MLPAWTRPAKDAEPARRDRRSPRSGAPQLKASCRRPLSPRPRPAAPCSGSRIRWPRRRACRDRARSPAHRSTHTARSNPNRQRGLQALTWRPWTWHLRRHLVWAALLLEALADFTRERAARAVAERAGMSGQVLRIRQRPRVAVRSGLATSSPSAISASTLS